jgi:nitronate monooxygenase
MWPDRRVIDLLGIELPVLQAPMAGSAFGELAAAVSDAGGLGALACPLLDAARIRAEVATIRARTGRPFNLNFFCHTQGPPDAAADARWREVLAGAYRDLGVAPGATVAGPVRRPFDAEMLALVEELRPAVVSFHFGLPAAELVAAVESTGAVILSSATTVAEARWLEARGCDAIVAQGAEAGGHRGMFLAEAAAQQVGTMALVPQIVDAVRVPVIAAGGIADARGIAAAFALGASAVQLGTAYLRCPEARPVAVHLAALRTAGDDATVITNVFTGRPARGIVNRLVREAGPVSAVAPPFPYAAGAVAPLRAAAEAAGSGDFTPMWAGQAVALASEEPAGLLTRRLADEAVARLASLGDRS